LRPRAHPGGIHGSYSACPLKSAIVCQRVTAEIKRKGRSAARRHDIAHLQTHLPEVLTGQGVRMLPTLKTQYRMLIFSAHIGSPAGDAQADYRLLAETFPVSGRVDETLEQLAMQIAEIVRRAEVGLALIVLAQQHTEIIIAHIGGEVVANHPFDALIGFAINNTGFQYLDQRNTFADAARLNIHFDG